MVCLFLQYFFVSLYLPGQDPVLKHGILIEVIKEILLL